jgi:hypothetical protein
MECENHPLGNIGHSNQGNEGTMLFFGKKKRLTDFASCAG